ncbi:MAG: pyridoxamine 5'-phosphate oxidase family protein [Chloroflexota bacterium]
MAILENEPSLLEALRGEMTPKFLATRSPEGVPNVVPCVSIQPAGDQPDTLFFGNFLLRKSIRNLESDARLAVLVITPELQGWILKGDFIEFQRTGPYYERQMNSGLLRYNAYTGVRNAGILRVRSVESSFRISKIQVALDYLRARLAQPASTPSSGASFIEMPLPVQREFARMVAVKVLAWIAPDGYPILRPALSLQPTGRGAMTAWLGSNLPVPPPGAPVTSNILTFEAISYQAKGQWAARGKAGTLQVQEIYAGGPPYPGGRVA